MSLRTLFIVQGEGRGHLTQAMALRRMLVEAGHCVEGVVVGNSQSRTVPSFFEDAFSAPVSYVDSPSFVPDRDDRAVQIGRTVLHELTRTRAFLDGLSAIDAAVDRHNPDVIVNFFEPLAGLYAARYRPETPIVAVAHQYMFHHPSYEFPSGRHFQRWAAKTFATVTAWGASRRIALSLYPAADGRSEDIVVLPPLLRQELFRQPTDRSEPFFLVYLLNTGYAEELIQWHNDNRHVRLHCFWDRAGAAEVEQYDETLTFHQLDDEKFLSMMARCRGLVSTAGFESIAEAMYLGKPVQVVPVEGHYEQCCNAFDTARVRAGIQSRQFDLSQLQKFRSRHSTDAEEFRRWVSTSKGQFVREIEAAAERREVPVRSPVSEPEFRVFETVQ